MDETNLDRGNIFTCLPANRNTEHFDTLARFGDGRLERIVSFGQCSPEGFWYDQDHSEWVLVLRGHAKLEVEGFPAPIALSPGDYINLTAHTRHRVAWTSPEEPTIWLAIHY
ncbi:MAG: cupin domain-containing protein [Gammaproteobacteria bacterium]|nr:cupin domain-containing protein [Gammaproteobacteria bacterium]